MKKFGILVLLVVVVIEMFASTDARFIQPDGIDVLKSAAVEHLGTSLKELLDSFDTKADASDNCSCKTTCMMSMMISICECEAYVNDTSTGIKGVFIYGTVYIEEEFIIVLELGDTLLLNMSANVGLSDTFTVVACNQSADTKGKNICISMDGHRASDNEQITACVRIESPPLKVNLGCFSFSTDDDNEEIQQDGSLKFVDKKKKYDFS